MDNARNAIEKLLSHKVSWLENNGPDNDIALSSRIRLARNVQGTPFPIAATPEQRNANREAIEKVIADSQCLGDDAFTFQIEELTPVQRQLLFERRLVSRELISRPQGAALVVTPDESCAIMINEEDHLRLQSLEPGFRLEEAWRRIDRLDNCLAAHLPYVYDSQLGYLTTCPTNVGTGMRASVMLHLPGLVLSGQITAAIQGISTIGLTVRGIYGEGTENLGSLFQISNQSTLGESEMMIIERLNSVIRQLITHEKNARIQLLERDKFALFNHVGRAYGLLRHSYLLTVPEAINSLSALRMGVDLRMFKSIDIYMVNELFLKVNPSHLQMAAGRELTEFELNVKRADVVREILQQAEKR